MANKTPIIIVGIIVAAGAAAATFFWDDIRRITSKDEVIATVKDDKIYRSDIENSIKAIQQANPAISFDSLSDEQKEGIIKNVYLSDIITERALNAGVDNQKEVKEQIQKAEDEAKSQLKSVRDVILKQAYLSEYGKELVKEEEIKAQYEASAKQLEGKEEIGARHILVKTKQEARNIVKELKGGASFVELAKARSLDTSSAQNDGDVGSFIQGQMVEPFEKAAFKLQPGEISPPVKTQFGWHVIEVTSRAPAKLQPYETIREDILEQLAQKAVQKYISELIENTEVTLAPLEGDASEKTNDNAEQESENDSSNKTSSSSEPSSEDVAGESDQQS